jgi:hypothetical protein
MSHWYAAHLILYVKLKDHAQRKYPVWENIVLIRARTEDEAFAKAEKRGQEDATEDDTFRWGGRPARWVFAGVRKLTLCEDPESRPGDGTEVSYTELEADSVQAVRKLVAGQPVAVTYQDRFEESEG